MGITATKGTPMNNSNSPFKPAVDIRAYLVRFEGGGYNTVQATGLRAARKQAQVQFAKCGIVSVALPKPGEVDALDAEWASRLD